MALSIDPGTVRRGRVRARYFRENFAQAGIDLAQIIPELVTNADAAIASGGRAHGRIVLRIGPADSEFRAVWRRELAPLGVPALLDWSHEICCTDNGVGVDAATVDARLGALGEMPEGQGQRGLFGRGLRDVWIAQGGGRIQGVRNGRAVESWFFPSADDDPYSFVHVLDEPAAASHSRELGVEGDGSRVTVPLAERRLPPAGRLRSLVSQLVQLRPILEDSARELWLELAGQPQQLVVAPTPEADPERPLLFDDEIEVSRGVTARIVVRRAADPIPLGPSRATRRGGLLVRSGRGAHEATLAGLEGHQGARHLYGDVWCDAIERLQREALASPRPQVAVRVDRSGLNESHPMVQKLYAAIERVLRPIVAAEERRAGAHLVSAGPALRARDAVGLRALNDALRTAFDAPGSAGFEAGGRPAAAAPLHSPEPVGEPPPGSESPPGAPSLAQPLRFKQSPVRLHPGEQRGVTLIVDPARLPPGTPIEIAADDGIALTLKRATVPEPGLRSWASVQGLLRASVAVEPGSRLEIIAQAGEHTAELDVMIVRHTAGGWVREIARKDEDAQIEAHFDPESGVVTVFEGRREFRALERGARRAGLSKRRIREYTPYRMLEVEVAANTVYQWAAERILERRVAAERPHDPAEYAAAVRLEVQSLRYRVHERLMRAFLEPEVFEGGVRLTKPPPVPDGGQASLLDEPA